MASAESVYERGLVSPGALTESEKAFVASVHDAHEHDPHHDDDHDAAFHYHAHHEETPLHEGRARARVTPFVYVLTAFSAIGGFLFGYDTGVVSGAMLLIKDDFDLNDMKQEIVVSAAIAGAILGAFSGGFLNDRFGRRPVIILGSVVFTAGSAIMAAAQAWTTLVVGRVVVGVGIGFASMTVPMYIAEAAPSHLRGKLVTINNLFITGGQFIAGVIDGAFANVPQGWRYMLGLAALPAAIQFVGFLFLPESPRWLLSKKRDADARRILVRVRGSEGVDGEMVEIKETLEDTDGRGSFMDLFRSRPILKALFVGCMLQLLQQLAGINTVMYYSATILKMAGFTSNTQAIWLSAAIAFCNFIFTIVGVYLVERSGRRKLLLWSLFGVSLSLVTLGLAFYIGDQHSPAISAGFGKCGGLWTCSSCVDRDGCGYCAPPSWGNGSLAAGYCMPGNSSVWDTRFGSCASTKWQYDYCKMSTWWLAIVSLIAYIACFAPGMGPMPWTINSEIYPLHVRSQGNSAATAVNWCCNLVVSMTFLTVTKAITTYGAFWLYAGICVAGIAFVYVFVPETKGRTLEDIQVLFASRGFAGLDDMRARAKTASKADSASHSYDAMPRASVGVVSATDVAPVKGRESRASSTR